MVSFVKRNLGKQNFITHRISETDPFLHYFLAKSRQTQPYGKQKARNRSRGYGPGGDLSPLRRCWGKVCLARKALQERSIRPNWIREVDHKWNRCFERSSSQGRGCHFESPQVRRIQRRVPSQDALQIAPVANQTRRRCQSTQNAREAKGRNDQDERDGKGQLKGGLWRSEERAWSWIFKTSQTTRRVEVIDWKLAQIAQQTSSSKRGYIGRHYSKRPRTCEQKPWETESFTPNQWQVKRLRQVAVAP